jgi:DNA-binding MarR family transcriptional regulator
MLEWILAHPRATGDEAAEALGTSQAQASAALRELCAAGRLVRRGTLPEPVWAESGTPVTETLAPSQQEALEALRENPGISARALEDICARSNTWAHRRLDELEELGLAYRDEKQRWHAITPEEAS